MRGFRSEQTSEEEICDVRVVCGARFFQEVDAVRVTMTDHVIASLRFLSRTHSYLKHGSQVSIGDWIN